MREIHRKGKTCKCEPHQLEQMLLAGWFTSIELEEKAAEVEKAAEEEKAAAAAARKVEAEAKKKAEAAAVVKK